MTKNKLDKLKGYIGIAKRANYVIFGVDNLKGYSHKLYFVLVRDDYSNTTQKVINELSVRNIPIITINIDEFNYIADTNNCKLLAIKNKGLAEQIIEILRSEG